MNGTIFDRRRAGMLAPVYALRHDHDFGIGDTISVRDAVDFCAATGFSVLQVLPILETIGDPSPYSPVCSRALSPALLSLTPESVPGLTQETIDRIAPEAWLRELRAGNVRHDAVHPLKMQLLTEAHTAFIADETGDLHRSYEAFKQAEQPWLTYYSLWRLLVQEYSGNIAFPEWRPEHRSPEAAEEWLRSHPDADALLKRRDSYVFMQWVASRQWKEVRAYADANDIRLIGDLTFGISAHSCDAWAEPDLFDVGWSMGTRPLAHFDTSKDAERWGQNWGFPPYRWENHRSSSFQWFRGRLRQMAGIFHGCRIDHLRGYFRAYMFPWAGGTKHIEFSHLSEAEVLLQTGGVLPRFVPGPDEDPACARMNEQQGKELINIMFDTGAGMDFVAEIMGEMPDYMARALEELPLANLNFPQLLLQPDGSIIPHDRFRKLALVTYANHDNAPLASLYLHLREQARVDPSGKEARELQALLDFAGWTGDAPEELDADLLGAFQKALFSTSSRLAMLMCTDLFGMCIRFNLPGSYGLDTWNERLPESLGAYLTKAPERDMIKRVTSMIKESGR